MKLDIYETKQEIRDLTKQLAYLEIEKSDLQYKIEQLNNNIERKQNTIWEKERFLEKITCTECGYNEVRQIDCVYCSSCLIKRLYQSYNNFLELLQDCGCYQCKNTNKQNIQGEVYEQNKTRV